MKQIFVKGAYLYTLDKELTEEEFIEKAGGMDKINKFKGYPFVTLVLDNPDKPLLVGHINGRVIHVVLSGHDHEKYQTMELK